MAATRRRRSAIRWLFEDRRTGAIVIGQKPNLLLRLAIASTALRVFSSMSASPPRPAASRPVRRFNLASLALFGLDELARGVNPFRRIGGGLVLLAVGVGRWTRKGRRS